MGRSKRKLIPISEATFQRIESASRAEACSIYKFMEMGLAVIIKANDMGYPPAKLERMLEVLQLHRDLGGVIVPRTIFVELLDAETDIGGSEEEPLEKWHESGRWHGTILNRISDAPISTFKLFLESIGWNLNEVEIREDGNSMRLTCVSSTITAEETESLSRFVSGALHGMGYKIENKDVMTGMIIMDCTDRADAPALECDGGH